MLTLLRVKEMYTPEPTDDREILIANGRIAAIGRNLSIPGDWPIEVVDLSHLRAVPGFVDQHVHITGGGGEGGFATRCPEIRVEEIVAAGVTTVVGVLGTDSISRSPADLLAKARALTAEGISGYMYTGAYRVPLPTLTGDIQKDITWIPEVLGVGEIAISDHRSGQPRQEEIERIASEARVAGMLAGKRGICHFHVGHGDRKLTPLRRLLSETEIPAEQVIPTHVNRARTLLEDAAAYAKEFGASVDVTTFEFPSDEAMGGADAVNLLLDQGVPIEQITMSSDSNGSLPEFDENGKYRGMRVAAISALLNDWQLFVRSERLPFEKALLPVTRNVAQVLGLSGVKGELSVGADADITLMDEELKPAAVFGKGRRLL